MKKTTKISQWILGLSFGIMGLISPAIVQADEAIHLDKMGGVYHLPVELNGVMTLNFILDTGAAEVSIPSDVVMTLMRTGTLKETDFLEEKTYSLADGSRVKSPRLVIRSIKIGTQTFYNVPATVSEAEGHLLLGQSLLEKLASWSFDPKKQILVLGEKSLTPEMPIQNVSSSPDSTVKFNAAKLSSPDSAVQYFFQSVAEKKFDLSWESLTQYSQNKIVQMVSDEEGQGSSPEEIRRLFETNHEAVQSGFWQSFRDSSKIPNIAPLAVYEVVKSKKNQAKVEVHVGDQSLDFNVYEEDGNWKLGLIETLEAKKKLKP